MASTHSGSLKITQDKLLNMLMHAATREDIAESKNDCIAHIKTTDANMVVMKEDLGRRIDETNANMAVMKEDLGRRIDETNVNILTLEKKLSGDIRWIRNILIVAILVPIALHFLP